MAKFQEQEARTTPDYEASFEGKLVNRQGLVVNDQGIAFGIVVDGSDTNTSGCRCDKHGNIYRKVGRVERVSHVRSRPRDPQPFKTCTGLRMARDCSVVAENGAKVGKLVEGNCHQVIGMAVHADGTVRDQQLNAQGYAERTIPPPSDNDDIKAIPAGDTRSGDAPKRLLSQNPMNIRVPRRRGPLEKRRHEPTRSFLGNNSEHQIEAEAERIRADNDVDELLRMWTYVEV